MNYILSIDQSTSCTKALLFDNEANLIAREDLPHLQIVNEKGWVEHNPKEIYKNIIQVVKNIIKNNKIETNNIKAVGISNQRETTVVWDKYTGETYYNAIVWQCGRAVDICEKLESHKDEIKDITGLNLSPYFSAAKMAWILENVENINKDRVICSTIDSYLIYRLSGNIEIKTDYSNASRTQLLNLKTLNWDDKILSYFNLDKKMMPRICPSDSLFCMTDFDSILPNKIPVHSVLGDSQAALFAQGCLKQGMVKATYGTGSSVMMNTGLNIINSKNLVTSIAWVMGKKINYVVEGNINYSGALTKWLIEDLKLINNVKEISSHVKNAKTLPLGFYIIPAFSGIGAPYWKQEARAMICGMDRTVGKEEFVKATEESIALQITDILKIMENESKKKISSLRVDGGPSNDSFLMQIQSDYSNLPILVSKVEELSGLGAAYASGIAIGFYDIKQVINSKYKKEYTPSIKEVERISKYEGWRKAVEHAINY